MPELILSLQARSVRLDLHPDLDAPTRAAIESAISGMGLLEDLLRWGAAAEPRRSIADVVVQDEYTHDVVLRWDPRWVLVFDST